MMTNADTDTREWLDARYAQTDERGVYVPHQPIYGFGAPPHDQGVVPRLTRTQRILDVLAGLDFASFVDVSGAEGYVAWLVERAHGARVVSSDLSPVAAQRMRAIFGLRALAADVHALPFQDGEFDVVLCSQTLEHVEDPLRAAQELLRVAARAVLITIPHEDIDDHHGGAHDHVHEFDLRSFDVLASGAVHVLSFPVLAPSTRWLGALVDGQERPVTGSGGRRVALRVANVLGPIVHRAAGRSLAGRLLERDRRVVDTSAYETAFILLLKDGATFDPEARGPGADWLLNQTVPAHLVSAARRDRT